MDPKSTTKDGKDSKDGKDGKDEKTVRDDIVEASRGMFNQHHSAPGPVIPQEFNVAEEGTKEERRAKAQELNGGNAGKGK